MGEPKYTIKYRYEQRDLPLHSDADPCRPSEVIVEISLPHLSSAKGIDLDVLEHLLTLESQDPVAYKLVLKLPYPVLEDQGAAKFDKATSTLVVTLPVKANKDPVSRLVSTDSGIGLEFDEDTIEAIQNNEEAPAIDKKPQETIEDRALPPYTCNIYEGLMVFTINVRNVVGD